MEQKATIHNYDIAPGHGASPAATTASVAGDFVTARENRALLTNGDTRLVGTKYDFLRGADSVDDNLRQKLVSMRDAGLKTARAWSMKELLRGLWDCKSERRAREWWSTWYFWATHSRLPPVIKVAKMIQRHLPNVLSYFTHRITNASAGASTLPRGSSSARSRSKSVRDVQSHCMSRLAVPRICQHRQRHGHGRSNSRTSHGAFAVKANSFSSEIASPSPSRSAREPTEADPRATNR